MNKILITGCAGLIGANLTNKLLSTYDNYIIGIDNFSSSCITNIYPFLKHKRFNFIESDFLSAKLPYSDIVFHCIGGKNAFYKSDKYEYINLQLKFLNKILEYTDSNSSKLIILTDFEDLTKNDTNTRVYNNFLNLYQDLITEYQDTKKTDVKIAKISRVYGFSFSKDCLQTIERIIYKALSQEDIIIENNIADYYILSDILCHALLTLAKSKSNKTINEITAYEQYELKNIAEFIINYTKSKSKLIIKNPQPIYQKHTPDTSLIDTMALERSFFNYEFCLTKEIEYFKIAYFQ